MPTTHTSRDLQLLDTSGDVGGCGCGGCGCRANSEAGIPIGTTTASTATAATKDNDMTTYTYAVTGMTCGHCVSAVTSELKTLDGVTEVTVDLVAGGTSTITVISTQPSDETQVAAALDEAGDYQLA